jgi:hypothetical protein
MRMKREPELHPGMGSTLANERAAAPARSTSFASTTSSSSRLASLFRPRAARKAT